MRLTIIIILLVILVVVGIGIYLYTKPRKATFIENFSVVDYIMGYINKTKP